MIRKRAADFDTQVIPDHEMAALLDEQAAFEELRPALLKDERYRDKYVAVLHHAVVDCDLSKFDLVRRVSKSFPAAVLYVGHVQFDEPPVELPSPELV